MSVDLIILIQQDRKTLADLIQDFSKADKDSRATRSNDAMNQVAMFVHGASAVIYPPLQDKITNGPALIQESLKRIRPIIDDIEQLERMSIEDTTYPGLFDQTFSRFLDHWDMEHSSIILLRDAMGTDFDQLGSRWITARVTAPTRPQRAEKQADAVQAATSEATGVTDAGEAPSLSQRLRHLINAAQEILTQEVLKRATLSTAGQQQTHGKEQAQVQDPTLPQGSSSASEAKACGCTDVCECTTKPSPSAPASGRA